MNTRYTKVATAVLAMAMGVSACATGTTPFNDGQPPSVQQKIIGCTALVAGGAVLGGVIGNNTGDGDARRGAQVGAVAGGGACAVWLIFERRQNKQRITLAQQNAAQQGRTVNDSWTDDQDNQPVNVAVAPSNQTQMRPVNGGPAQTCRSLNTTASVSSTSDSVKEIWCKDANGVWGPAPGEMVPA